MVGVESKEWSGSGVEWRGVEWRSGIEEEWSGGVEWRSGKRVARNPSSSFSEAQFSVDNRVTAQHSSQYTCAVVYTAAYH